MVTPFRFKYFDIYQDKCAMKIGADAMLLGAFINIEGARRVLDIGTGTGVLALMTAQKIALAFPDQSYKIDAIEIDKDAATQAKENCASSPWKDSIEVICNSLENYSANSNCTYDLIISNPPYFEDRTPGKGGVVPAMKDERKKARLSDHLSVSELMIGVGKLLDENGRFQMIFPSSEAQNVIACAKENSLFLNEIIHIKSFENSDVIRNIFTFSYFQKEIRETEFIIYESPRKYSVQYLELTKEFHGKEL